MREDLLYSLTDEQIHKVYQCKSSIEILALAKEEGVELTQEQLAAINGGCGASADDKKDNHRKIED